MLHVPGAVVDGVEEAGRIACGPDVRHRRLEKLIHADALPWVHVQAGCFGQLRTRGDTDGDHGKIAGDLAPALEPGS